jgi:hypothetical protein
MCLHQNYFNINFISLVVHYHVNITMSTLTTIVVSTNKPNGKEMLWMVHHTQTHYLVCKKNCYASFLLHMFMLLLFLLFLLGFGFLLVCRLINFWITKNHLKTHSKKLYTQTQNFLNPIHTWIDSKLKHNSLH